MADDMINYAFEITPRYIEICEAIATCKGRMTAYKQSRDVLADAAGNAFVEGKDEVANALREAIKQIDEQINVTRGAQRGCEAEHQDFIKNAPLKQRVDPVIEELDRDHAAS
jgi:hypothetical protein